MQTTYQQDLLTIPQSQNGIGKGAMGPFLAPFLMQGNDPSPSHCDNVVFSDFICVVIVMTTTARRKPLELTTNRIFKASSTSKIQLMCVFQFRKVRDNQKWPVLQAFRGSAQRSSITAQAIGHAAREYPNYKLSLQQSRVLGIVHSRTAKNKPKG